MGQLLERVGPDAGHAFTKQLDEVVRHCKSIMTIIFYFDYLD
jgi:hypothetical protein